MNQLRCKGEELQIFPDYPPAVAKRRTLFNRTREILRGQAGVKYGLLYPAKLLVIHDGVQATFADPQKAQEYAESLFRTLRTS